MGKVYSLAALSKDRQVIKVGIADMALSNNPKATVITYALGSCIGLMLHDPVKNIGGLLHFLLPSQTADTGARNKSPLTYADSGFNLFLNEILKAGAVKRRLKVKIAGGARVLKSSGAMDIGRKNYEALLSQLMQHRLPIVAKDVGGTTSRTAMLECDTGLVTIRRGQEIIQI